MKEVQQGEWWALKVTTASGGRALSLQPSKEKAIERVGVIESLSIGATAEVVPVRVAIEEIKEPGDGG